MESKALRLVAKVAIVAATLLESNKVSTENQKRVQQLSERSLIVSRMIEQNVKESRPQNDAFNVFVSSFRATMTEVVGFAVKLKQSGWMEWLCNGNADKLQFEDLWRRLDAHAADFRGYLMQNMISKGPVISIGPADRIEHPQMREFWRTGMNNVLEAKWLHFWDQLLHDFPAAHQFLSGPSASSYKAKLQARAIPYDANFVGPRQINNLFHPPESSVENITSTVLGFDQRPVKLSGIERQVSILYWRLLVMCGLALLLLVGVLLWLRHYTTTPTFCLCRLLR